ncbi:uncharacterized protein LOC105423768 [Pogonomyrmex barbatus]|uniref:Uncharacterized protein LOC105423768 n=1 Tax=Pogonomyrmex barbatus TaxID=144034 RepID=A0A6I9WJR7_9HYME|nr:uncharacterized protein LOC105423768 [Pogonomyrmex barbatus]
MDFADEHECHAESNAVTMQNILAFHKFRREISNGVLLIVHRGDIIFDYVIVKACGVYRYSEFKQILSDHHCENEYKYKQYTWLCKKGLNSYLVSAYITMLIKSYVYRRSAMKILLHFQITWNLYDVENLQIIFIRLRTPRKQFLDYKWNEKLMQIVIERQEADHAMSWLSTLGGAFSALGEEFEHCAKMAGQISVKQFELALRLDNPLLVARCKLYAALSLIQCGQFIAPKYMIQRIYKFAIKEKDVRLQNMCRGVWAKLQYNYKQRKRSLSFKTLHITSKI